MHTHPLQLYVLEQGCFLYFYIQCCLYHGQESPDPCQCLRTAAKVVSAFGIWNRLELPFGLLLTFGKELVEQVDVQHPWLIYVILGHS